MREEFLITRSGKQYALFAGLLDEAHSQGLVGIDTELVQVPEDANGHVAIVKAIATIEPHDAAKSEPQTVKTFSGIGDASPQNVSRNIVPHLIRMAETRAKARALRDAVNASVAVLDDETPPAEDAGPRQDSPGQSADQQSPRQNNRSNMRAVDGGRPDTGDEQHEELASANDREMIVELAMEFYAVSDHATAREKVENALGERYGISTLHELKKHQAEKAIGQLTPSVDPTQDAHGHDAANDA